MSFPKSTQSIGKVDPADLAIFLRITGVVLAGLAVSTIGLVYLESLALLLLGLLIAMPGAVICMILEVTRKLTIGAKSRTASDKRFGG